MEKNTWQITRLSMVGLSAAAHNKLKDAFLRQQAPGKQAGNPDIMCASNVPAGEEG
jgi:hypothetical protein